MKIVVAGDVLYDCNLVRQPRVPANYHEQIPHAVQKQSPGGAWYLTELVRLACSDKEPGAEVLTYRLPASPQEGEAPFSRAYSIWSLHPREEESAERVWRIQEFLGCEEPTKTAEPLAIDQDVADPDLLVIDDLAQGFRNHEELWPAALRDGGKPKRIILKTVVSLPEGPLWEYLRRKHLDRLTVVMPAVVFRAHSKVMSQSFSWDHIIELATQEFEEGVAAKELGMCRRVVVQFGEAGAASFTRCRLRFGPPLGDELKATGDLAPGKVSFERFLFHPEDMEGSWLAKRPGRVVGSTSVFTAALARHELDPESYPLFLALGRGLAATRVNHDVGGGGESDHSPTAASEKLLRTYHPEPGQPEPADAYSAAFPRSLTSMRARAADKDLAPDLLSDLTGPRLAYVAAKATDVVYRGPETALAAVPKARYGKYLTVDREEIERINAIRSSILSYQDDPSDLKPLSIAVFGPPGSGKSFAIKQLAAELFGRRKAILEVNVSQLGGLGDLHTEFHKVRDASVRGQIPLVFWDEFDSSDLEWLKDFLAPMQDAEFQAGSTTHPFGKAIFVFAGGTCHNFETFNKSSDKSAEVRETFRQRKGPDFVSRLRGFVNIKGPNPIKLSDPKAVSSEAPENREKSKKLAQLDPAHLIRRAVMARSILEREYPNLIDAKTGLASISPSIVRGLLKVEEYSHGVRSLESVVKMSTLARPSQYSVADLPPPDQLTLHVSRDFLEKVQAGQLEVEAIEALAKAVHEAWRGERESAGWSHGEERDDVAKKHPLLVPYAQLSEEAKEGNRLTARLTEAKLLEVGFTIKPSETTDPSALTEEERKVREEFSAKAEALAKIEHDIWLRNRLLAGYEWAEQSDDTLRQNPDIAPFEMLGSKGQQIDRAIVRSIPDALLESGYQLVRTDGNDET